MDTPIVQPLPIHAFAAVVRAPVRHLPNLPKTKGDVTDRSGCGNNYPDDCSRSSATAPQRWCLQCVCEFDEAVVTFDPTPGGRR